MPAPDLPDPLVPGDVDLRAMPFVKLDVREALESVAAIVADPFEYMASDLLRLWAWRQVPAASLPDDDRELAAMSRMGRRWPKVRAAVLRGWVRCNDGRLYHPDLAEQAIEAWGRHEAYLESKASDADRLKRARMQQRQAVAQARERGLDVAWNTPIARLRELLAEAPAQRPDTAPDTDLTRPDSRKGEGQAEGRKNPSAYAEAPPAAAAAPPAEAVASSASPRQCHLPLDVRDDLANAGVGLVMRITGKGEGRSRALLGRWRRESRDDHGLVLAVLRRAEAEKPAEPVAWIEGAIKARAGNVARGVPNEQADAPAPAPRPAPAPVDPSHPLAGIASSVDPSIWRSWISRLGLASVTPGEEATVLAPSEFFRDAIRRDHLPLLSRALGVPKVRVLVAAPAGTG